MSSDIVVSHRTQKIVVNPPSKSVSVVRAGPTGAAGPTGPQGVPGAGEVIHDWEESGWTPFTTRVVNDDASNSASQSLSVVGNRGRITNSGAAGNLRVAYEHGVTDSYDSEVLSLFFGSDYHSTSGTDPATVQPGHFHRAYVDVDGRWRAVVITTNIFLSDTNVVNCNVWNIDPDEPDPEATLDLGSNGGSKTYTVGQLRQDLSIRGVRRFNFGAWYNEYQVDPRSVRGLGPPQEVTIDAQLDSTFAAATATPIAGVDSGLLNVLEDTETSGVATKYESGTITPTSASARRYWPYYVRSRLIGNTCKVKVWRMTDQEPDWSDARVAVYDFSGAQIPTPNAQMPVDNGVCGVIGAHVRNNRFIEYGEWRWRNLD